jgi:hypothetical protein
MPFDVRSGLATTSSGMIGGETHRCYNCGEISHLRHVFPKPPKEKDSSGRWQSGGRGCNRGDMRGGG